MLDGPLDKHPFQPFPLDQQSNRLEIAYLYRNPYSQMRPRPRIRPLLQQVFRQGVITSQYRSTQRIPLVRVGRWRIVVKQIFHQRVHARRPKQATRQLVACQRSMPFHLPYHIDGADGVAQRAIQIVAIPCE